MATDGVNEVRISPPDLAGASPNADAGRRQLVGTASASVAFTPDAIDQQLMAHLLSNPQATNREVAQEVGVSESAVSIRIKKLMRVGTLVFTALIDWEAAGFEWFVITRIRTSGVRPADVAAAIAEFDGCEAVAVTVGAFDLAAYFLVRDREELHALLNEDLPAVEGVADVVADMATETTVTALGRQYFLARNPPAIRLPDPAIEIDDLDVAVIEALTRDSRQSSRAIARALGVAEGTVRARMARLDTAKLCRVVAMADPISMGYAGVISDISVAVDRAAYAEVHARLLALPETVFLAGTVGSSALVLCAVTGDQQQLVDLVAETIRAIPGVRAAEALPMVDVVRFSPYLKRL